VPPTPEKTLFDFVKGFFIPTVIGKICVLYYGINYSQYPGEGYGYGLAVSVAATVGSLVMLIYKYRNTEDL